MQPTRAAWFFTAGIVWLALRGILVHAMPQLQTDQIAEQGGLVLIVPLVTVVASLTAPLFFFSFLFQHRFSGQRVLQGATALAGVGSLISSLLVLTGFVFTARGGDIATIPSFLTSSLLYQVIPFLFVGPLFLFLVAFARQSGCSTGLRSSAVVAAIGTLIPFAMMAMWAIHSRFEGVFSWYPSFSQGLSARVLGLAAAAALLWFLESFAGTYDGGAETAENG